MEDDIFGSLPFGKVALRKLAPVSQDFRIYLVEVLQGDGKNDKPITKVTGADFIRYRRFPNVGKLSKSMVKGTQRVTYLCCHEVEECFYCRSGYPVEYRSGFGWYHFRDGGPDAACINPDIISKPNPEGEE